MTNSASTLLDRFEQRQIDAPDFRHQDHIQVAYEMLDEHEFVDACARYASTIRAVTESVGVPEKYNATITLAFMSLIAERKSQTIGDDFEAFLETNPDLLDSNILARWYSRERLASPVARRQFLLPDKLSELPSGAI